MADKVMDLDQQTWTVLNNIVIFRAKQMMSTDEKRARQIFRQVQLGKRKFKGPDAEWLIEEKLLENNGKMPNEIAACIDLFLKSL